MHTTARRTLGLAGGLLAVGTTAGAAILSPAGQASGLHVILPESASLLLLAACLAVAARLIQKRAPRP
jgi:hypothetical protein